jgi:hypothetical protein
MGVGLGSIGVGLGLGVPAGANIGVGLVGPFREEAAREGVACAFMKACSCRFLNSSASFFSFCFCRKKRTPSPRRMIAIMMFFITRVKK